MRLPSPGSRYAVATTRATSVGPGRPDRTRPARGPGLLLGLGLGGFIDGIVLHQIFQWHHLVSHTQGRPVDTVAGLKANTLADGLFHAGVWLLVLLGVVLMVRNWQRGLEAPGSRYQAGLLLSGWGLFNVTEGLINHHVLGIHHVRDDLGGPLSWDLAFLGLGVVLTVAGWALHRAGGHFPANRV